MHVLSRIRALYRDSVGKTWKVSQAYEWDATKAFMETDAFRDALDATRRSVQAREGYGAMAPSFSSFFGNEQQQWREFAQFIEGKRVLEIGPSLLGIVCSWWWAKEKFVIEPLIDRIVAREEEVCGFNPYSGITCYAQAAEKLIPELVGRIDGAIVCRNMLDHTPQWVFVLSAIASYAAPGAKLLLWNDLHHYPRPDTGHYNLTEDVPAFKRLCENLGFNIDLEFQDQERDALNLGMVATKVR